MRRYWRPAENDTIRHTWSTPENDVEIKQNCFPHQVAVYLKHLEEMRHYWRPAGKDTIRHTLLDQHT